MENKAEIVGLAIAGAVVLALVYSSTRKTTVAGAPIVVGQDANATAREALGMPVQPPLPERFRYVAPDLTPIPINVIQIMSGGSYLGPEARRPTAPAPEGPTPLQGSSSACGCQKSAVSFTPDVSELQANLNSILSEKFSGLVQEITDSMPDYMKQFMNNEEGARLMGVANTQIEDFTRASEKGVDWQEGSEYNAYGQKIGYGLKTRASVRGSQFEQYKTGFSIGASSF